MEGTTLYIDWYFSFNYNGEEYKYSSDGCTIPFVKHHSPVSNMLAIIEDELDLPVVFGKDGY
jgi:hypothetical protein